MDNRVMPHDTDAEKVVLGTIMSDRNALNEVREILSPNCFYDNLNNLQKRNMTMDEFEIWKNKHGTK